MPQVIAGVADSVVGRLNGTWYEHVCAGQAFHGCTSTAGVAIVAVGTTPGVALYNPAGNTKFAQIIDVEIALVSGTFVLGGIMHGVNTVTTAAATTGTAGTVTPGLIGSKFSPTCSFLTAATLPANPTPLRPITTKYPTAATASWALTFDLPDGIIVLAPGSTWSLFSYGADTSPLLVIGVSWVETNIKSVT